MVLEGVARSLGNGDEDRAQIAPASHEAGAKRTGEPPRPLPLVWFDPASVERIRRVPAWRPLLERMQPASGDLPREGDDGDAALPWAIEDADEVLEVLGHAEEMKAAAIDAPPRQAYPAGSRLPLVLLVGEVETHFDELESLKAAVIVASMVPERDEALRDAIERAARLLNDAHAANLPTLAALFMAPIREALAKKKALASGFEATMERALFSGRHFQKRSVFGDPHVRCSSRLAGETGVRVCYLPEGAAKQLPKLRRFQARLIAEVHPRQDEDDAGEHALRVLALARG
jgi:hypothetical protein